MSTIDLAPAPSPASSSASQPDGGHFLNGIPLPDGMKNMILSFYNGARNALYGYSNGPAPSTETSEEPIQLQPPVNDEQVPSTDQALKDTLGQPPLNHNSTFASQGDDLESGDGDDSNGAPHNSQRMRMRMTVLIVGVPLIVVPGLVLGFVTRQVQWGIGLSGAIATVVGVFVALTCPCSRRD